MTFRTLILRRRKPIACLYLHATTFPQRCRVHSSRLSRAQGPIASLPSNQVYELPSEFTPSSKLSKSSSLSILPTGQILRTYCITRMSSTPVLMKACFYMLRRILSSGSVFMSTDRNPVLKWFFKRTFYAQFCAGENKEEVRVTAERVKSRGFTGVILEYALEILEADVPTKEITDQEIAVFRQGMLDTIEVAERGDFLGLKWSGLGREAFHLIKHNKPPSPAMEACLHELCDAAYAKGSYFLPGAEEEYMNHGVDAWTLGLQKRYNVKKPFMYNTYQSYLRSTPQKLAQHLAKAEKEGYIPAVKLVRGAYLLSEPKEAVWNSWEETSKQYDGLVDALLRRKWNDTLKSPNGDPNAPFPKTIGVMLATHNVESIRKAQYIRNEQARHGEERIELAYAQLQGMADELSCELVAASKAAEGVEGVDQPRPFKCATWGPLRECLHFLVRRASENQDAMGRTVETRSAMAEELLRRMRRLIGLS